MLVISIGLSWEKVFLRQVVRGCQELYEGMNVEIGFL